MKTNKLTAEELTKKLLFYLLAAILGGCVPVMSLHPLFTEETLVFEEELLGTWVDDPNSPKTTWEFQRVADSSEKDWELPPEIREKAYKLIYSDDKGKKGSFFAGLGTCFERLFLNVCPSRFPCAQPDPNEDWTYNKLLFMPGYTFIIIDSIEPQLKMRWITDDAMKELLKEDPNAVKFETLEDDKIVLTASTKELQAFVLKYADDERLFGDAIVLSRKKPEEPADPNRIEQKAVEPNEAPKDK